MDLHKRFTNIIHITLYFYIFWACLELTNISILNSAISNEIELPSLMPFSQLSLQTSIYDSLREMRYQTFSMLLVSC